MELLTGIQHALRQYLVIRGAQSRYVALDGRNVHFYDLDGDGAGPPVVLVHGLGSSANGFYKLFPGLAERFRRVLALDLPGNGFSGLPDRGRAGREEQLHALCRFLESVPDAPVFLVGTSLGGAMSITAAHRRPELVRSLGLIAPAGARVAEERMAEVLRAFDCRTNAEARALTRRLFHKAPIGALLLAPDLRRMFATDAVRAVLQEAKPSDALEPELLQRLHVPTLLIWGQSEKLLPFEGIDFFRAHLPAHAEIRVVERFGHVPQMEHPAELVRELVSFADRAGL